MKKREVDHSLLDKAKINKKDEFYTQLIDIEKEVVYYTKHFRDKVVYCNCDDPEYSNFWKFFYEHFEGEAPIIGSPFTSFTQPVIVLLFCC